MGRKKQREYIIDDDGFINAFVDGCCLCPDKPVRASGYGVYFGPNNQCRIYGPCKKKATNITAEIQGAYRAIAAASSMKITKLCVNTDSQVVYDAATDLISKWKENNWHGFSSGAPIANRVYFERLERFILENPQMKIKFNRVDSHSGNVHHNEADHLARMGAELHCNYHKLNL